MRANRGKLFYLCVSIHLMTIRGWGWGWGVGVGGGILVIYVLALIS